MEKMLVVIFDTESKAYAGSRALVQLDDDGSIAVHAKAVVKKNPDGTATMKELKDEFPLGSITGTALGSLIGLLEGPVGFAVGASAGMFAGLVSDLYSAGVGAEFVDDVTRTLTPGKCALIADISEEWETPVDTRMEALGGIVFRTPRQDVGQDQRAREIAALREELANVQAEYAKARADRRAKLEARMNMIEDSIEKKVEEAERRTEQLQAEVDRKVHALQEKAAKTQGNIKATLDARVSQIQKAYAASQANVKHVVANQLRATAARIER